MKPIVNIITAISGTSANTNSVSMLDTGFADPDMEALRQEVNEMILNGETKDLIRQHPEVAQRLRALAQRMREDMGDSATNQKGKNRRPVGRVPASGQ